MEHETGGRANTNTHTHTGPVPALTTPRRAGAKPQRTGNAPRHSLDIGLRLVGPGEAAQHGDEKVVVADVRRRVLLDVGKLVELRTKAAG